jgi:archaea-specific DNA-binding protein
MLYFSIAYYLLAFMNTEITKQAGDNVIFVGNKPVMNYVLAAVTQFNEGNKVVIIKARGRAISRAVDTAEVIRHRFMLDVKVDHIEISTEELTSEKGDIINVSSIEIFLTRP